MDYHKVSFTIVCIVMLALSGEAYAMQDSSSSSSSGFAISAIQEIQQSASHKILYAELSIYHLPSGKGPRIDIAQRWDIREYRSLKATSIPVTPNTPLVSVVFSECNPSTTRYPLCLPPKFGWTPPVALPYDLLKGKEEGDYVYIPLHEGPILHCTIIRPIQWSSMAQKWILRKTPFRKILQKLKNEFDLQSSQTPAQITRKEVYLLWEEMSYLADQYSKANTKAKEKREKQLEFYKKYFTDNPQTIPETLEEFEQLESLQQEVIELMGRKPLEEEAYILEQRNRAKEEKIAAQRKEEWRQERVKFYVQDFTAHPEKIPVTLEVFNKLDTFKQTAIMSMGRKPRDT